MTTPPAAAPDVFAVPLPVLLAVVLALTSPLNIFAGCRVANLTMPVERAGVLREARRFIVQ